MKSIRANRSATGARFGGTSWNIVVTNLNHVLRGWTAYFRYGNSASKFEDIDVYVHERLALLASRKHGIAGWNLGRSNWEWLRSLNVALRPDPWVILGGGRVGVGSGRRGRGGTGR